MSPNFRRNNGFSIIELLVVMSVMVILTTISFLYLSQTKTLYQADDQSLKIIDILQEARQRSLTQREPMRVEIDLTDNVVRLFDENRTTTVNDDIKIKEFNLLPSVEVRIDQRPSQIDVNPAEDFPVPTALFKQSIYPASQTHNVCTIRFMSNGKVEDQGTDATGANAATSGLTLHVWSPKKNNNTESQIARAITIIGSTGSIRMWEYDSSLPTANKWKDTRRTSIFGGQTTGTGNSNTNQ